jgi:hypothetical protein
VDPKTLSTEQLQRLAKALEVWVERHPAPDDPVLSFIGGKPLTPRQIVGEVTRNTPDGQMFLRMVHIGLEVLTFEQLLAGFVIEPNAGGQAGWVGMGGPGRGEGQMGAGMWAGGGRGGPGRPGAPDATGVRGPWAGRGGARGPGQFADRTGGANANDPEGVAGWPGRRET